MSIFILLMLSSLWIEEAYASPDTDSSKMVDNIDQDSIILFSQNYSETNNLPANVFIAKVQREKAYDKLYSSIYATQESKVFFNNTSEGLKYANIRDSPLIPCSLLPGMDLISCFGINEYLGRFRSNLDIFTFCKCTSVPIIHYLEEPRHAGALYICSLTPMVKCDYEISMDINADDPQSFVELNSPGSRIIIQKNEGQTLLKSYYKDSSGETRYEKVVLGNASEKANFNIIFDGYNKTNTIYAEDGNSIVTPFYNLDRQNLPYLDFSNGYIKFTGFVLGEGTNLDVDIYSINQTAERKLITAIGDSRIIPFGLDGPVNGTEEGIDYLKSKGYRGTIWFDKELLEKYNETHINYLRSLVANDSWEVGIHYTKELNSLPLEEAYRVMDEEYQYVYEKIGKKPTSCCCLRNHDNLKHAIYGYENLGMTWRNGDAVIHAERDVGNLYDDTWEWWEPASKAGMSFPVFTHQLDLEPAIKYSISRSYFRDWVDNYYANNMTIVSFYEYNQISRNTYDASFDNLQYNEKLLAFDAHTNGDSALVNVNITAGNDTQVYDTTLKKYLDYEMEQDKSITFQVEDNHTYKIDLNSLE